MQASSTPRLTIRGLAPALAAVGLLIAGLLLLVYAASAAAWLDRPFLGAFLERDLTIGRAESLAGAAWPAVDAGLRQGDRLTALDDADLEAVPVAGRLGALYDLLAERAPGETVTVRFEREGEAVPAGAQCDDLPTLGGARTCTLDVTLADFPAGDFAAYFAPGWVAGAILWALAALLFARRPASPLVQIVTLVVAAFAVLVAGQFAVLAAQTAAWPWLVALALSGGLLVVLALEVPYRFAAVEQMPALGVAPAVAGLAVGVASATLYGAHDAETSRLGLGLALGTHVLGGAILLAVMLWRRGRASSLAVRSQSTILAFGALMALLPLAAWLVALIVSGAGVPALAVLTQTLPALLPLSALFAVAQGGQLDTDRLAARAGLYAALLALLTLSYFVLVAGVAALLGRSLRDLAVSPALIVLAIFGVALAFNPLRQSMQRRIDAVYYRARSAYQPLLEEFSREVTNAVGLDQVARLLVHALDAGLAPAYAILFVRDAATGEYRPRPDPETGQRLTDVVFGAESGLVRYLRARPGLLSLEEGRPLPLEVVGSRASLAVLGAPVIVGLGGQKGLNAILAIGPRRGGAPYGYEDLRFIESLSDQVALAVERAQAVDDLERRVRVQDVLSQVSRALNFAIDLDTLLELIYAQTRRVIDAPVFAIALRDASTNTLHYVFYNEGEDRLPRLEERRWPLGPDLVSEVVRTQQPLRTDDYAGESLRRDANTPPDNPRLKAWLGVPLLADTGGGVLGVMITALTEAGVTFSDEQQDLFVDIANLAASAIDKLQLFDKMQQRARQLAAINEIANQLASEMGNVDRLLSLITENAVQILESEAGTLLLVDENAGNLEVRVVVGGDQALVGARLPLNEGLAGETVQRGAPIIANAPPPDAGTDGAPGAILSVPLLASGRAIGVLQVREKRGGGVFGPEDADMLSTFAGQAAVAIENARLFDMTDQQLALRVQELDTMQRIDYELNRTLDLRRVVDIMMDWALRKSGATACAFFMRERGQGTLRMVMSYGYPSGSPFAPSPEARTFRDDEGVLGRVVRTARPSLVSDLALDPDYSETLPGCVAQLTVPLISAGQVIGVMLLESDQDGALDLLDLDFAARLAEHATPAIVNSQLFQELQRANVAKSEFVSFVAHELRNPMTSLRGYTDLLLKGVVGPVNPQQSDFLHTIFHNVMRMETLVSDLNDLTKQQTNNLRLDIAPVSFAEVVTETLRAQQRMLDDKEQTVTVDVPERLPAALGDRTRLVQIMTNFVSNANKYTPEGGAVTIRARAVRNVWDPQGAPEVIHCSVQDTGIGMSEEDLRQLFTPYFRSDDPAVREQPGTGLGLTITRGLIEQHGGRVWVESTPGEGTTFHFTVPVAVEGATAGSRR
ncbi:MAG: GAF domain-containing protein [Chloroflexota bacterium]|jgi:signal transduction histidine kinase